MAELEKRYREFKTTIGQLRTKLTTSELAALSTASLCASEANTIFRLAWLSKYESDMGDVITWLSYGLEVSIIRTLTTRLHAFWKFVDECQNQNGVVGELAKLTVAEYTPKFPAGGRRIANVIRDRAAAHTSLADAKTILKSVDDDTEVAIFETDERHNSFSTLGEEVFTFGQIFDARGASEAKSAFIEWFEWARHVDTALGEFHNKLFKSLVVERFPEIAVTSKSVNYPPGYYVNASQDFHLPYLIEGIPN